MADHYDRHCPFRFLEGADRIQFLAINHFSFCIKCNSRSPQHTNCENRSCPECKQKGHYSLPHLCKGFMGEDTPQAWKAQMVEVTAFRDDYFRRVRTLLKEGKLLYFLAHDISHTPHFRRLAKGQTIQGWEPYDDVDGEFATISRELYVNGPGEYSALTVPEMDPEKALPIIAVTPAEAAYFEEVGRILVSLNSNVIDKDTLVIPRPPGYPVTEPAVRAHQNPEGSPEGSDGSPNECERSDNSHTGWTTREGESGKGSRSPDKEASASSPMSVQPDAPKTLAVVSPIASPDDASPKDENSGSKESNRVTSHESSEKEPDSESPTHKFYPDSNASASDETKHGWLLVILCSEHSMCLLFEFINVYFALTEKTTRRSRYTEKMIRSLTILVLVFCFSWVTCMAMVFLCGRLTSNQLVITLARSYANF
uniref:Polyprotein n=1 Tax=Caenorhabditis tropicalis TaxID=1561998 RepID=A0A1I7UHD8_9PELO